MMRKLAAIVVICSLSLLVPAMPAHAAPDPDPQVAIIGPAPWYIIACGQEIETGSDICSLIGSTNSIVWGGEGDVATFEATNGAVAILASIFLVNYLIYEALTAPPAPMCYNCSDGFKRSLYITSPAQ